MYFDNLIAVPNLTSGGQVLGYLHFYLVSLTDSHTTARQSLRGHIGARDVCSYLQLPIPKTPILRAQIVDGAERL